MIRKLAALVLILTTGLGLTIAYPAQAPISGGGGYYTSPTDSYSGDSDTQDSTTDSTESDFQTGTDTNDDGSTEQDFQSDSDSDTDSTTPDQNDDGTTDSTQEDTTTSDSSSDTDSTESDFQTGTDTNDDGSSEDDFQDGSSDQNDDGSSEDDFNSGGDQNDDGTSEDDFKNSLPTASISYTPQNPTPGETVSFDGSDSSDSDGSIEGYAWSGAFDASGETTEYSFSEEGSYTVELTVTDNNGGEDSSTVTVNVEKEQSTTGGGGNGGGNGGSNDGEDGGNNGGDDNDDGNDDDGDNQDNENPTAEFSYTPEKPVVDDSIEFDGSDSSDEDGTVESYSWDFDGDGSFEADGKEQSMQFDSAGTKSVTLKVEDNDGATDSLSKDIEVQENEDEGDDDNDGGDGDNEDNNEEDDDSSSGGGGSSDFEWSDSGTDTSPDPELKASISSTNPSFGETLTVSGSIENIDEERTVEIFFSGEKVAETTTENSFSEKFRADKIGQNSVKVVSEDLEKSFSINVQTTVEIIDINTNNYLSLGQQHQACVEIESSSPSTVELYQNGNRVGERIGQRTVCFDNSAPENPGALEYRAVATAGDKTDEFTKRVPVVDLQPDQEEPTTPTGGFFEERSNLLLSLLLLLVLIAAYYRERIKQYSMGFIRP